MTSAPHDDTSQEPTPGRPGARRPRRAVRRGTETTAFAGVSDDERPGGWGDPATTDGAGSGQNDDRLLQDVPPHYGKH
ncbi:hypothetical protein [Cellulosimicrobium sp. Marseille-Q4280]|uniref:hypothetical protein n=1 Tax=Cellulosimicrobium sp. Marseille-Q4280 TaxID=2937992 RepID=UPI00203AA1E7|nr:hypothetical protein [Cellulosimicrobium sp. Marseille-Q4280]